MTTIKDVAKRAGVSLSTVSYALSGKRPVSKKVKAKVEQAMQELNYTPTPAAKHLREGRSGVVGMVFPLPSPGLEWVGLDFVSAAAQVLQERYTLNLISAPLSEVRLREVITRKTVDGLIVMEILRDDPRVNLLNKSDLPFVTIGRTRDPAGLSFVDFDYQAAARKAVRHLAELGHRQIAVIDFAEGEHVKGLGFIHHLQRGLTQVERELGLRLERVRTGPTLEQGAAATQALLENKPTLTALVALNGATHVGALRALHDLGLAVPEDISLVSVSPRKAAAYLVPGITSVDVPFEQLGALAAQSLLELLEGSTDVKQELVAAKLVVRESSARPKIEVKSNEP